jgi:hypothetical protein
MSTIRIALVVLVLAAVLYPLYDGARRLAVFTKGVSYKDGDCAILNQSNFAGLEDITLVYEDASVADFVAAYDRRRETWLDHSFRFDHPQPVKSALIHIRVDKKPEDAARRCTKTSNACITVREAPFTLKDETVIFHPHGIFFDKVAQKLYVLNHAMRFGGERAEVFQMKRDAATGAIAFTGLQSLTWAAGMYPPLNFTWWPPHLTSNRIAEHGSAWGIMNDVTLDRVNNRLLFSVWKPHPLPRKYPKKEDRRHEIGMILASVLSNPTLFLSCPADRDSCKADPPIAQCVRSTQRYSAANGIQSNRKGDIIIVADMGLHRLVFEQPVVPSKKAAAAGETVALPEYRTLGYHALSYSIDNTELHSDNATHFCMANSVIQRLDEGRRVTEDWRSTRMAGGASIVCCPYTAANGHADGQRGVDAAGCREEVLFLSDGKNMNVQTGISVAVALDNAGAWSGRDSSTRLVLTGSWYDGGVGVCWV